MYNINKKIFLFLVIFPITSFCFSQANYENPIEFNACVSVRSYVLYKDHIIVFTPLFGLGISVPVEENIEVYNTYCFSFGYKYFIDSVPHMFFLENLIVDLGVKYHATDNFMIEAFIDTNLDFRELITHSTLLPGAKVSYKLADLFTPAVGFKSEIYPGNHFRNVQIPFFTIDSTFINNKELVFCAAYEGSFGIKLNDYNDRLINTDKNSEMYVHESIEEIKPFLNYYGQNLVLNLSFLKNYAFQYKIENIFLFSRVGQKLQFEQYETMRATNFTVDFLINYLLSNTEE